MHQMLLFAVKTVLKKKKLRFASSEFSTKTNTDPLQKISLSLFQALLRLSGRKENSSPIMHSSELYSTLLCRRVSL